MTLKEQLRRKGAVMGVFILTALVAGFALGQGLARLHFFCY